MLCLFRYASCLRILKAIAFLNREPSFKSYGLDPRSPQVGIVNQIRIYGEEREVMVTDLPIYAFWAGMVTPVDLTWVSNKRLNVGLLSDKDFINVVMRDEPKLVLVGRFPLVELREFLEIDYELVHKVVDSNGAETDLYLRRDN